MEKKDAIQTKDLLRNYDALQDKHASFYFNGYGVKKHLRKLKKAIEMEPPSRNYKQYTSKLTQKISQIDEKTQSAKYHIQPYEQSLKPASLYKLQRMQTFLCQTPKHSSVRKKFISHKNNQSSSEQQLPNLGKVKFTDKSNTQHLQQEPSIEPINRTTKISSVMNNSNKTGSIMHRRRINADINRQRSNQSLQVKIGVRSPYKKHEFKEVKHQDFMSFLRKKQQLVRNFSKTIEHQPSSTLES